LLCKALCLFRKCYANICAQMSRRKHSHPPKPHSRPEHRRGAPSHRSGEGGQRIYGLHAVAAALRNPHRKLRQLWLTEAGEKALAALPDLAGVLASLPHTVVSASDLAGLVPEGAVHQGAALAAEPLLELGIEDICQTAPDPATGRRTIVVLDQVSDPRNVGAILRSAAAFGAVGLVTTERHAAPVTGVLAKAASGALETVPIVTVTNLARAMDDLKDFGFWRIGLDSHGTTDLAGELPGKDIAVVLGAEGAGLRRLTREKCDLIARLPISTKVESLNVSAAAAVALYELSRKR
jgi:23S rRNA (guanosine2251-2'-O)-methyltransferase